MQNENLLAYIEICIYLRPDHIPTRCCHPNIKKFKIFFTIDQMLIQEKDKKLLPVEKYMMTFIFQFFAQVLYNTLSEILTLQIIKSTHV